jgi:hypothetical protein
MTLASEVLKRVTQRSKLSQVNHLVGVMHNQKVHGPARRSCLNQLPQFQPVLTDSSLHGKVMDEFATLAQQMSYARVVPVNKGVTPAHPPQLDIKDASQYLQRLHPLRSFIFSHPQFQV